MTQLTRNAQAGDLGVSLGGAGAAPFTGSQYTPIPAARQVTDSPHVVALRQAVEIAKREGDYDGFCLARKLLLLAQASEYMEARR